MILYEKYFLILVTEQTQISHRSSVNDISSHNDNTIKDLLYRFAICTVGSH